MNANAQEAHRIRRRINLKGKPIEKYKSTLNYHLEFKGIFTFVQKHFKIHV